MHQGRHICKAHKAAPQKLALQKSLSCSHASGTHPTSEDKYVIVTHPKEGRTYNRGLTKWRLKYMFLNHSNSIYLHYISGANVTRTSVTSPSPSTLYVSMRALLTIFSFCFLALVSTTLFGQKKSISGTFYTTGYYSGLTITLKPDMTFSLKYQGHISSDTAAGTYKLHGDTVSLTYDYNNYERVFCIF